MLLSFFSRGFDPHSFLLTSNLSSNLREVKWRLIYSGLSIILSAGLVYTLYEDVLFTLSPNVPSFFLYSHPFEVILSKITLSLKIGGWLTLPHLGLTFYLFFRPAFFRSDPLFFHYPLKLLIILPPLILLLAVYVVGVYLQEDYSYYYRYLPTIRSIEGFIGKGMVLANMVTMTIIILKILIRKKPDVYPKYRLGILYVITAIFSSFLPPDFLYLISVVGGTVVMGEGVSYMSYVGEEYERAVKKKTN